MRSDFWRVALLFAAGIGAGTALGHPWLALLLAVCAVMAWYYRALLALLGYLRRGDEDRLPDLPGIVNELTREFEKLRAFYRQREERLAGFLERFQEAAAALPDAILILDQDGAIQWANGRAHDFLGISWPQDAHQRLVNLVRHPELVALFEAGRSMGTLEITSPGQGDRQLALMLVPYGRDQTLVVARDVTTTHRLLQIRRDFVANVSHELRTPLTVINGYLEMLSQEEAAWPESWKPALGQIVAQTRRMQALIEDLLLLSRLEQDASVADPKTVPVAEMLNRIYQEAKILSGERAHIFSLDIDASLRLRGSEQELYSAFSNILLNAVRYTPARGVIRIRWFRDAAGAHFEVRDSGVGIPPEHIPRLTERFYRVDKGRSRDKGGTGLGLAIVKHVLNRHQARLHIESVVGQGSLFRCDFPPEVCVTGAQEPRLERSA